jgi:AcrR family transcriptional regulator
VPGIPVSPKAGLDEAQVLRAAAQIVDVEGQDALTLAALARRLGVRTPSLYNHITGMAGLRRDLALLSTRQLCTRLARATIGKTTDDAILALAEAFRSYIREHAGLYSLTVKASRLQEPADLALAAAEDEVVQIVMAVLASYGLHGQTAIHAVRGLRSLVHGFATLENAGGFGLPLDTEESFRLLVRMLIGGIHALASTGGPTHRKTAGYW